MVVSPVLAGGSSCASILNDAQPAIMTIGAAASPDVLSDPFCIDMQATSAHHVGDLLCAPAVEAGAHRSVATEELPRLPRQGAAKPLRHPRPSQTRADPPRPHAANPPARNFYQHRHGRQDLSPLHAPSFMFLHRPQLSSNPTYADRNAGAIDLHYHMPCPPFHSITPPASYPYYSGMHGPYSIPPSSVAPSPLNASPAGAFSRRPSPPSQLLPSHRYSRHDRDNRQLSPYLSANVPGPYAATLLDGQPPLCGWYSGSLSQSVPDPDIAITSISPTVSDSPSEKRTEDTSTTC